MKLNINPAKGQKLLGRIVLGTAVLALLPHLARSYDINEGLRVGNMATSNSAVGYSSLVLGSYNSSGYGDNRLTVGNGNTLTCYSGAGTIAVGSYNYLVAYNGFMFGNSHMNTSGSNSMLTGSANSCASYNAFSYGANNQISSTAAGAMAGGSYNIAEGENSVALGRFVSAKTFASVVIGQYNATGTAEDDYSAKYSWRPTDPLFVVGNGTAVTPKNAMVITKDGTVTIDRVPARGGISMGSFTAP